MACGHAPDAPVKHGCACLEPCCYVFEKRAHNRWGDRGLSVGRCICKRCTCGAKGRKPIG